MRVRPVFALVLAGCSPAPAPAPTPAPTNGFATRTIEWGKWLPARACFAIREGTSGAPVVNARAACAERHRPYSTFKIPNALIGLDVGILTGPDAPMPWDQEKYPAQPYWPDAWRKDHTLRSGMAVSAVPAFRLLATKIGAERMRAGLARLHYGNEDVGGGLDLFWLKGAIRISGAEQLELVSKLSAGTLPFSAEAQRSLREAIRIEESPGATLFGKTGTGSAKDDEDQSDDVPTRAWLVGWVETKGERYPFASWVEGPTTKEARAMRTKAVWGILRELGLLPPDQAGR